MQNLWFEDYEDLACNIVTILGEVRKEDIYNDVAIVAKYEETRQIIKELVSFGYDLRSIQLEDNCYGGYDAEYIISICNIDGEDEIWCEPMLREDGYLLDESTVIYVLDNCSSKIIPYCNGTVVYEVGIGEDECRCDCDECCGCCECDNDSELAIEADGDMHGFSVNRSDENGYSSYSFYSTDMDLVEHMARLFR